MVLVVPNDKDAKLKMQECEKIVRRMAFLQAIEVGDPPSAAEGLDLDSIGMCALARGCRKWQVAD